MAQREERQVERACLRLCRWHTEVVPIACWTRDAGPRAEPRLESENPSAISRGSRGAVMVSGKNTLGPLRSPVASRGGQVDSATNEWTGVPVPEREGLFEYAA